MIGSTYGTSAVTNCRDHRLQAAPMASVDSLLFSSVHAHARCRRLQHHAFNSMRASAHGLFPNEEAARQAPAHPGDLSGARPKTFMGVALQSIGYCSRRQLVLFSVNRYHWPVQP